MSAQTQELLSICEQLPEAQRIELADFARFLLARAGTAGTAADRWLGSAVGAAQRAVTTDGVLNESRGEA